MLRTKSYFIKDLLNPLSVIVSLVFLFINVYLFIFFVCLSLLYASWRSVVIKVSESKLEINRPFWPFFTKEWNCQWESIEKLFIKKYGRGGYGSLPYIDIYFKNSRFNKKRIVYSPSMRGSEFDQFVKCLHKMLGERLVISERQP